MLSFQSANLMNPFSSSYYYFSRYHQLSLPAKD